ncbi:MAG: helix-turn-helix domain-containing protein [Bacteroidales bacterium]|nr:helix-turn-helix domain-containing protein [Bacteroidales bacterium]
MGSINEASQEVAIYYRIGFIVILVSHMLLIYRRKYSILETSKNTISTNPSQLAYLHLGWQKGIAASVAAFIVGVVWLNLYTAQGHFSAVVILNLLLLISGGLVGYLGMKQDALITQVARMSYTLHQKSNISGPPEEIHPAIENKKVDKKPAIIPESEAQLIISGLLEFMKDKKPFLNPAFSMNDLCKELNVNRRIMTYVLNEVKGQGFYAVVNEFRIKEAIHHLEDGYKTHTIETVSEMVGFQSKSSFYACFKKYTGRLPKDFMDNKSLS